MHKTGGESPGRQAWKKFKKDPWAMGGLMFIILCCLVALLGYAITPDPTPDANTQSLETALAKPFTTITFLRQEKKTTQKTQWIKKVLYGSPSAYTDIPVRSYEVKDSMVRADVYINYRKNMVDTAVFRGPAIIKKKTFILGSDRYGRDVLSRLMIGTRITMMVGCIAVAISLLAGIILGALAGYFGGKTDSIISWMMNVVWSIPTLLLVLTITISVGKGLVPVFIAVGLTMWVDVARMVRGEIFSVREKEFVAAGKVLGFSSARIIFKHILPNVMASVLVIASSNFASAILIESGLSFLGLGAQPPTPTWGNMIETHRNFIITEHAYLAIIPGFAILLLVLAFTMVSNGWKNAIER